MQVTPGMDADAATQGAGIVDGAGDVPSGCILPRLGLQSGCKQKGATSVEVALSGSGGRI